MDNLISYTDQTTKLFYNKKESNYAIMCYVSSLCRKGDIFPYNHTQGKKRVGKNINCIPCMKKKEAQKKKKRVGAERHLFLIFLIHRARKGTEYVEPAIQL